MTDSANILSVDSVTFGFPERPDFLHPVNLCIGRGQCWGIIGPNGAGKSTLLRLLAGLVQPKSGTIRFEGKILGSMSARDRARRIGFLPQNPPRDVALSARQVVLMGRYPHRQFGLFESAEDFRIANHAMAATQTSEFADRSLATLSGGEAQRVHIAAALSQEPVLLLLDEPTAALDLYHQLSIFSMLAESAIALNMVIVVVTHDLNLAARYCTHLLLLDGGRPVGVGAPDDVLRPERLESVYGVPMKRLMTEDGHRWLVPMPPNVKRPLTRGGAA